MRDVEMVPWLAFLKDRPPVRELGIDISQAAVNRARSRSINAKPLPIDSMVGGTHDIGFDYVIMSEVVEHLPDPEDFLVTAWSLAEKAVVVTFPNIAYWPHRLRLFLGRFPRQWANHPGEHLRFWSIPDFKHWLSQQKIGPADILC